MKRKKTRQESAILIVITVIAIAGMAIFITRILFPDFFNKKSDEEENVAISNESEGVYGEIENITIEKLKEKIDANEDFVLLDVQNTVNYIEASIPTSVSIPLSELDSRFEELPKNKEIIVVDGGGNCQECSRAAEILVSNGFVDIKRLNGGVISWVDSGYPIVTGVKTTYKNINSEGLMDRIETKEDIIILDVRNKEEYDNEHIQGAVHVPFENLSSSIDDFAKTVEIIIYDKNGNRSKIAVEQFVKKGYTNVINLLNGFSEWTESGYPTNSGSN